MDFETIYRERAEDYDRLVSAEDCDGRLVPALEALCPLDGARVVDVGTGTGRIARLVVHRVAQVVGVEPSPAMLAVARRRLESTGRTNWKLLQGSAEGLPVESAWADIVVAGWVFGHFRSWMPAAWRSQVARAVGEMGRCAKPGARLAIVETLGTGTEEPRAPSAELAEYFAWLEAEQGFTRTTLRTDYRFADVETAATVCGFFFGDALASKIRERGWMRVPECTGVWSR
jgi:ubiquinone/menaquinone biosynthesis C-methylase UbiE